MAIPVKLQVFEGPLDLLLHLIDINKIDIYDIPISLITDQYLQYIQPCDGGHAAAHQVENAAARGEGA